MKILISSTGEVSIETNGSDPKAIAELIRELQKPSKKKTEPRPEPVISEPMEEVPLSAVQMETWQWLVENDTPTGRSPQELAEALGLEEGTAGARLRRLIENGLAYRVSRGLYRPGERGRAMGHE